jgi:hypothetical protein
MAFRPQNQLSESYPFWTARCSMHVSLQPLLQPRNILIHKRVVAMLSFKLYVLHVASGPALAFLAALG